MEVDRALWMMYKTQYSMDAEAIAPTSSVSMLDMNRVRPWLGGLRRALPLGEVGVILPLAVSVAFFYALNPAFLSGQDLRAILGAVSFVGIIGVGQTLLLVGGEFDLSVGSVAGFSAIVSAWLMTKGQLPVAPALLAGVLSGGLLGLVNGLIVVRIGIPAFITTLGMLYIAQGLNYLIDDGYPIYPLPPVISQLGQPIPVLGVGLSLALFVILAVAGEVFLRRTTYGRNLYAIGGNQEVARLVGINVARYKLACFVLVGMLAAVAGILVMADVESGTPTVGQDWALVVIAGVVIGGVSLFGGVGSVVGGALGMVLLQVVQSGLVVIGVSPHWQVVSVGGIMIVAVGLDLVRRRLTGRRLFAARVIPERQTRTRAQPTDLGGESK